jgi:hypothetical protein
LIDCFAFDFVKRCAQALLFPNGPVIVRSQPLFERRFTLFELLLKYRNLLVEVDNTGILRAKLAGVLRPPED